MKFLLNIQSFLYVSLLLLSVFCRHASACGMTKIWHSFTLDGCTAHYRVPACSGLCETSNFHQLNPKIKIFMTVQDSSCCTSCSRPSVSRKKLVFTCADGEKFEKKVWLTKPTACGCTSCLAPHWTTTCWGGHPWLYMQPRYLLSYSKA